MNVWQKLINIQKELKAPKNQFNSFGKYKYRNLEDILEGVKPLLYKYETIINISDEIVLIGERYYVKATATLVGVDKGDKISSTAYAREDENKKGMDLSQLSGSTSSYARKYALNGLFAIDDTKDSDSTNLGQAEDKSSTNTNKQTKGNTGAFKLSEGQIKRLYAIAGSKLINANTVKAQVKTKLNKEVEDLSKAEYDAVVKGYESIKGEK